ncbi:MAG: rod shape-determining protein RodA, partial [Rickettsiaceae bacterium]|nr:rod shape-determining protein RodA [Rickettsiaceae bacterium]
MTKSYYPQFSGNNFYSQINKLPKTLLFFILLNCLYGFVILYSAGQNQLSPWALRQIINFAFFFPVMILIAITNIRTLFQYSYPFFLVVFTLLVLVHFFGHTAMGATRWLGIGSFRIQPSELAKLGIVFFLARYFHNLRGSTISKLRYLIVPALVSIGIAALIIKQPDLGTGIVVIMVSGILFYIAGARIWIFLLVILAILASMPFAWYKLHDYQKKRVEVFLDPSKDPLGSGYNIIQSKIAIGSGGLTGKGLGQGSQSHLSFLPEHQTDFIFACLCEDLGFIGAFILLMIYISITHLSLSIAINARTIFGKLLASGASSIFFIHAFINIGMVSGMLPVVGIPLPLISYGGTMMGSMLIGFGM